MYFLFLFASISIPPDTLHLEYYYSHSTVPPPYHYEYEIVIYNSNLTLTFYPNYPSIDSTFWKYQFQISQEQKESLVRLIQKAILRVEMKRRASFQEKEDLRIGGPTQFCNIEMSSRGVFLFSDEDSQLEEVAALYQFLNHTLIPERIWSEIMEKHENYMETWKDEE